MKIKTKFRFPRKKRSKENVQKQSQKKNRKIKCRIFALFSGIEQKVERKIADNVFTQNKCHCLEKKIFFSLQFSKLLDFSSHCNFKLNVHNTVIVEKITETLFS